MCLEPPSLGQNIRGLKKKRTKRSCEKEWKELMSKTSGRIEIITEFNWLKGISRPQGGWIVWPLLSDPGRMEVEVQQGKSHRSWLTLLPLQTQPHMATNTSGHRRKDKPENEDGSRHNCFLHWKSCLEPMASRDSSFRVAQADS